MFQRLLQVTMHTLNAFMITVLGIGFLTALLFLALVGVSAAYPLAVSYLIWTTLLKDWWTHFRK